MLVQIAFFFFLSPAPSDSADLDARWVPCLLTLPLVTALLLIHHPSRGGERTSGRRRAFGNQGWESCSGWSQSPRDFMAPQKGAQALLVPSARAFHTGGAKEGFWSFRDKLELQVSSNTPGKQALLAVLEGVHTALFEKQSSASEVDCSELLPLAILWSSDGVAGGIHGMGRCRSWSVC